MKEWVKEVRKAKQSKGKKRKEMKRNGMERKRNEKEKKKRRIILQGTFFLISTFFLLTNYLKIRKEHLEFICNGKENSFLCLF